MGNLVQILDLKNKYFEDIDESVQLKNFFDVMQRFNKKKPLKKQISDEISAYFDYRWQKHKAYAFSE